MIPNTETDTNTGKPTCEWNTKDAPEVREGVDPDGLLLAHLNVTAVLGLIAVVRIKIV